jgi:hypothetical protein
MNSNLHADSIQQNRHNIFEHNEKFDKKVSPIGFAYPAREMRETERVYKLHSIVN